MLLEGVYARLAADAGLLALGCSGVYPSISPKESSLPLVVYTQVGGATESTFEGVNRLQSARLRFSCYGATYSAAKKLAAAVKASLGGLSATLTDGTKVEHCELEFEGDESEAALEGTVYGSHVDFSLMFVDES